MSIKRGLALPVGGAIACLAALAALSVGSAGADPVPTPGSPNKLLASPAFTPAEFSSPGAALRPKFRWWQPVADTADAQIQAEVQNMANDGGGGFEQNGFAVSMNAGGDTSQFSTYASSQQFGQVYGWGSPLWSHRTEVYQVAAEQHGVIGDMNEGSRWNNTTPSVYSPNQVADAHDLSYGDAQYLAGENPSGELPTTTAPALGGENTALSVQANVGATTIQVQNIAGLLAGDQITLGAGTSIEHATIASVGTASPAVPLSQAASAGSSVIHVAPASTATGLTPGSNQTPAQFVAGETVMIGSCLPTPAAGCESDTIASVGTYDVATTSTTLSAAASAGATNVRVASTSNFLAGDTITIDSGATNVESDTIVSVGGAGAGTTLSAAPSAGALSITVASASGLSAGDYITVDTGALAEVDRITIVSGTTLNLYTPLVDAHASGAAVALQGAGITLKTPLVNSHASGAAAIDTGTGITLTTPLQNSHPAGDTFIAPGTGVTLTAPLTMTHLVGANTRVATTLSAATAAGASNIRLASLSNVRQGDTLTIGQPGYQENATVASVGTLASGTTLTAAAAAGATNISLASTVNLTPGDVLTIDTGANLETATIAPGGVGVASNSTTLSAATVIGATNIKVASVTGLAPSNTLVIDTGSNQETATILTVGTAGSGGTGVTLTAGLTKAHASGATVFAPHSGVTLTGGLAFAHASGVTVSDPGTGLTLSAPLTLRHYSGDPVVNASTHTIPSEPTTLAAAPSVGANTIDVTSAAGFAVPDSPTVGATGSTETVTIVSIGAAGAGANGGTVVTVRPALTLAHNQGDPVTDAATNPGLAASAGLSDIEVETPVAVELVQCLAPSVADGDVNPTTTLSAATVAGATVIHPASVTNMSAGDQLTVGTGAAAQTVTIAAGGVGTAGATGTGVTLSAPLTNAYASATAVYDTCPSAATGGVRELDQTTAVNVTGQVNPAPQSTNDGHALNFTPGTLNYTANGGALPVGNGQPWELIDLYSEGDTQTNSGGTATTPAFWIGHLSDADAQAMADWFDNNILNDPATQAAIYYQDAHNGTPAAFEDSIEDSSNLHWESNMISSWQSDLGYDPTLLLPAIAGTGKSATSAAVFDFPQSDGQGATFGWRVRQDYAQMFSNLYVNDYVQTMDNWADAHGMVTRFQSYGDPIDDAYSSANTGIPEGEHYEFNGDDQTQQFKVIASGTYQSGNPITSDECCEDTGSAAWADTFGIDGTGSGSPGSTIHYTGAYVWEDFVGGVNQIVFHGWPYTTGAAGSPALWPGNTYGGDTSYEAANGPNMPGFADDHQDNNQIARVTLALRQGQPSFDVGVYHQDLGLSGQGTDSLATGENLGTVISGGVAQTSPTTGQLIRSASSMSQAGYTYGYLSPEFFRYPTATFGVDPNEPDQGNPGGDNKALLAGHGDYKALVIYNQTVMPVDVAQKIATLAGQGLPVVIVGQVPSASPSPVGGSLAGMATADGQVQAAMAAVLACESAGCGGSTSPTVAVVADSTAAGSSSADANLPGALESLGIGPAMTLGTQFAGSSTPVLDLRRHDPSTNTDYYFMFNQSTTATIYPSLTLTGSGTPYVLNATDGAITPIANYTTSSDHVTLSVRIAPGNYDLLAISPTNLAQTGITPAVHATSTTANATPSPSDNVSYNSSGQLEVKAAAGGNTTLAANSVTQGAPPLPVPTYATANWIDNVPNAAAGTDPTGTFFVRKDFTLTATQLADMQDAVLRANVDDQYEAFINGTLVASSTITNGWETSELANIMPYLQVGNNVIAMAPYNAGSQGSLIAEIQMDFTAAAGVPNNQILIASDGTWLADQLGGVDCSTAAAACIASNAPANWNLPSFNDSGWFPMYVSGAFGISPWTGIPVPTWPSQPEPYIILVNSVSGFKPGDRIAVDTGSNQETDTIAAGGVGTAGVNGTGLTLVNNLTIVHSTGAAVVDLTGSSPFTTTLSNGETVSSNITVPAASSFSGPNVTVINSQPVLTGWQLWVDSWGPVPSGDPTQTQHSEIPACAGATNLPGVTSATLLPGPALAEPPSGPPSSPPAPGEGSVSGCSTFAVAPLAGTTNGALPSWVNITPANGYAYQDNLTNVAGIGTYTTTFNLPATWSSATAGAYMNVGVAVDTVDIWVNGQLVPAIDQNDRNQVDIGPWLVPGANTLAISVSTPLRDAVTVAPATPAACYSDFLTTPPTGLPCQVANSSETIGALQGGTKETNMGLIGPVTLTPYGQTELPPVTTATLSGPSHDGYFTAAPTATLTATTDTGGPATGATTYYQLDSTSGAWSTYNGPFSITAADGNHTLYYYSVDSNGVAEPYQSTALSIDTTPPVTTATISPTPLNCVASPPAGSSCQVNGPATITLNALDNLSGVANTYYAIDGGATQTYTGPFTITAGGLHIVTYHSVDVAGNIEATKTLNIQVNPQGSTTVTGTVPSTLAISVGTVTPSLGAFQPGVAQTYTATIGATVTTTAASSTLTAADLSPTFPGHLVNNTASGGPYGLTQGLQVDATSANPSASGSGVYTNLASTNPATILSYTAPVSNDAVTIGFKQPIAATDPLRTGTYTKTITFTLSTSTP